MQRDSDLSSLNPVVVTRYLCRLSSSKRRLFGLARFPSSDRPSLRPSEKFSKVSLGSVVRSFAKRLL